MQGCTDDMQGSCTWTRPFTSGRVRTQQSLFGNWKYGEHASSVVQLQCACHMPCPARTRPPVSLAVLLTAAFTLPCTLQVDLRCAPRCRPASSCGPPSG